MSPKVLLVEDDAVTAKACQLLLASCGCEVRHASHFEAALALCRAGWPEVILLDIQLPLEDISGIGTWSGFDFLVWLRGMIPNPPPVYVISSQDDTPSQDKARKAGAAGFFSKPISKQELIPAVFQSVGKPVPFVISTAAAESKTVKGKTPQQDCSRLRTWWKDLFSRRAA